MKAKCENCRHYREVEMMEGDGGRVTLGYCHAIHTYPYRRPDQTCKKYHYDERKAIQQ